MFKLDNMPQLSPYLTVRDGLKSINFYRDGFGFTTAAQVKDDNGIPQHVAMRKVNAFIMFSPAGMYDPPKKSACQYRYQHT